MLRKPTSTRTETGHFQHMSKLGEKRLDRAFHTGGIAVDNLGEADRLVVEDIEPRGDGRHARRLEDDAVELHVRKVRDLLGSGSPALMPLSARYTLEPNLAQLAVDATSIGFAPLCATATFHATAECGSSRYPCSS